MNELKLKKRNGEEVAFQSQKIENAIRKANLSVPETDRISEEMIHAVTADIATAYAADGKIKSVEDIQLNVIKQLMKVGAHDLAISYTEYRHQHELLRRENSTDRQILALVKGRDEESKTENSNKDTDIAPTMRDYTAGIVNRDMAERYIFSPEAVRAHKAGAIHIHDMDYSLVPMYNCCLINLDDMLQNGTVISGTKIDTPHSFATACNVATQIIAQVASSQYGGQSISLTHLAKFVDVSRQKLINEVREEFSDMLEGMPDRSKKIAEIAEKRLSQEIKAGVQTIQYQILTLMTTNGQAPFVTVFMYLGETEDERLKKDLALVIEAVLRQRILGVKNEQGVWITPAFPKLIYVLEDDNAYEGTPYWYLTCLAAECTAHRMVPDYISEKVMKQQKADKNGEGHCYPVMGCRSALTPYIDENGKPKYYGRFNQGVVSINLPYVAIESQGDHEKFDELLEHYLRLCHNALRTRHERLLGTTSDIAPILWQHGAIARLKPGEKIDRLLYGGYSTISLGYAGLYECTRYMTGLSHTDREGKPFALRVMRALNDACAQWKAAENIDYSLYGTPLESTTYKFAKANRCLARKTTGGDIEGITNYDYVTNSYHVNVREEIDAFTKLSFESEFQALSPGGAISYVEVPNMTNNIDAVLAVMQHIYENIMYAELNTKLDYCMECGYEGEIRIVKTSEDTRKSFWKCPCCGNTDEKRMSITRRTCGYLGQHGFNTGRLMEISDRKLHL